MLACELPVMPAWTDPDTELIRDCQAGCTEAFGTLVARHRDGVYNFIRHTVISPTDAQDLAQEAFIRAYSAIGRFRCDAPFEPWLYTIAANVCRSHLRKARRRPEFVDSDTATDSLSAPPTANPALAVEQHDEHLRMLAAIHALPADQRMVVVLRHLQDRSYREIATILKIPVSTVEHRLRAARQVLWSCLQDDVSLPRGGDK